MKKLKRIPILLFLSLTLVATATSQDGGQICVMSFEDRNGNGSFDENEPPVTQGVAVNLQNADGITLATKLLEASSYAVPGLLCLEDLPRGEYRLLLTSAQYQATTGSVFGALVAPGSAPLRLDFGLTSLAPVAAEEPQSSTFQLTAEQLQSLRSMGIGLIASMLIGFVMFMLGWLSYSLLFRRRLKKLRAAQLHKPPNSPPDQLAGATTQQLGMALAIQTPTSPVRFEPGAGSPALFADDDTNPNPVA